MPEDKNAKKPETKEKRRSGADSQTNCPHQIEALRLEAKRAN
jgi:hypothetical protein